MSEEYQEHLLIPRALKLGQDGITQCLELNVGGNAELFLCRGAV
jgi:hypothetical protein